MKKLLFLLAAALLLTSNAIAETSFSLAALKTETAKALPEGLSSVKEIQENGSAFIAYMDANQGSYQFTLSADNESQMPAEEKIEIAGRECEFFRPMGESSGGLFIPLGNDKGSLVILIMHGMFSDVTVASADLKAIASKMNLTVFD